MKKYAVVVIILLLIISSVTPMVIGNRTETKDVDTELEAELANLRYLCTYPDGFNDAEYESYKEELLNSYSKDDTAVVEPVEAVVNDYSPAAVSFGPMNSSWPMKCHDTHHTSQSPYSTADNPLEEMWKFRTTNHIRGGIIIGDDDTIYFGCFDGYLHALNQYGTEKWRYKTGMWIWSAPAIDEDGTVYVTSYDDYLHAVNPDGTLKWKFLADDSTSSPAISDDGTIYFGGMGDVSNIFAVNPDGTEKWRYATGYLITSDPAIGDDGTIYIGSGDDYLYAMNPNGTLKWRFKTGDIVKGHPSIADDGTIYINSFDNNVYALNPNGTEKWRFGGSYSGSNSVSIANDGTIYICGKAIYALNPNGSLKWTFDLGSNKYAGHSSAAISADGTIYIGTYFSPGSSNDGGEIVAVNPDGTEKWRKWIADDSVQSSPCIGSDGTVYVGSASTTYAGSTYGYLHAFGEWDPTAPEAPSINGETQGHYGESYDYTFVSNDPENQDIRYYIDWGDGSYKDWIGPYSSGQEITVSHTWDEENTYTIRAKAKDTLDVESPWSTLEVTMPINQQSYSFPLLQRLLERFPNAFPILRYLIETQY